MSDIATVWVPDLSTGDWQQAGAALLAGNDLASAVLISLFTDRVAARDDALPDDSDDPRGWWGDLDQDVKIGSRLWLLSRAKADAQTLNRARTYIREALDWLIQDGVVASFDISVSYQQPGFMAAQIIARMPDAQAITLQYAWVWRSLNAV